MTGERDTDVQSRRKKLIDDMRERGDLVEPATTSTIADLLYDELTDLPTVHLLLRRIRRLLKESKQLGLLSISVLGRERLDRALGWQDYETLVRDVSSFLIDIKKNTLRREDHLSDVMISGNAFVILLAPPRQGRRIKQSDINKVRRRVEEKLGRFVRDRLPAEAAERFGVYVGCAMLNHQESVRFERLVYSSLEEAFKDSLQQRQRFQDQDATKLERILKTRSVHTVYQPVVDLQERRTIGFEALTRISNGSFEGPDRLFQVAHQNDAIWKLERICRARAIKGARGLASNQLLFLNVEPESIHDPMLRAESTFKLLRSSGLTPTQVVLEITEHSAVRDLAMFRQVLDFFKFQGFRLAVDDVGSGYSGLSSIAELKPDFIKIDMALIRGIDSHPIKQDLTRTITRFSRSSGITLIAEGVETPEEMRCLRDIGVRYEQGYLFARPGAPFPRVSQKAFE